MPDLPLLSTWQRGRLSVSLTAQPVMSVTPGDTGSHVFWACSEQLKHYFFFILSSWIQLFFPSHTVPRTSEQLAVTRWSFLAGFSAAREGFIGSRWVWTEGDEPKEGASFFLNTLSNLSVNLTRPVTPTISSDFGFIRLFIWLLVCLLPFVSQMCADDLLKFCFLVYVLGTLFYIPYDEEEVM